MDSQLVIARQLHRIRAKCCRCYKSQIQFQGKQISIPFQSLAESKSNNPKSFYVEQIVGQFLRKEASSTNVSESVSVDSNVSSALAA